MEHVIQVATAAVPTQHHPPWNKGRMTGQKVPFKLKEIYTIRVVLQLDHNTRDLALFNTAIDSKTRSCDLVNLKVEDVLRGDQIVKRARVLQRKTKRPVTFEITPTTRKSLMDWIGAAGLKAGDYLFPSRLKRGGHLSTRQYARIVKHWAEIAGTDPSLYGTHSLRRTKATILYAQTRDIRSIQLLLGHTKIENTVRYLGVDVDVALKLSEDTEI